MKHLDIPRLRLPRAAALLAVPAAMALLSASSSPAVLFAAAQPSFCEAVNGPATAIPACIGMDENEPIDPDNVFIPNATSPDVTERCPCTVSTVPGLLLKFPPNSANPYQWMLFDQGSTNLNFTHCPQVFCFLRFALQTIPPRFVETVNGTTVSTERAALTFSGIDYSGLPENTPQGIGAYKSGQYNSNQPVGLPQTLFNQQSIWIKGVSTDQTSDCLPVDILIEKCVFTGTWTGSGLNWGYGQLGAGVAFSYRIPEGSTVVIRNNAFSGTFATSVFNYNNVNYQTAPFALMANAIFPSSACSVCFTAVIAEDKVKVSISENKFYNVCVQRPAQQNNKPFWSDMLGVQSNSVGNANNYAYASQCAPVGLYGVQMYGGAFDIVRNDFGNALGQQNYLYGSISIPFFSFVTAQAGVFETDEYAVPPAVAPSLTIANNVGTGMSGSQQAQFFASVNVTDMALDNRHLLAGGNITISNHTIAPRSPNAWSPYLSVLVNASTPQETTADDRHPMHVDVSNNWFPNALGSMVPIPNSQIVNAPSLVLGFASGSATEGSTFVANNNTVQCSSNNNNNPFSIAYAELENNAMLLLLKNAVTMSSNAQSSTNPHIPAIAFASRPIAASGSNFAFSRNTINGVSFDANATAFAANGLIGPKRPIGWPGSTGSQNAPLVNTAGQYCYRCEESDVSQEFCSFRLTTPFDISMLCP